MEKTLARRQARENAFLTAFSASFQPEEEPISLTDEEHPLDAFAQRTLQDMTAHSGEIDGIIEAHLKDWTLQRVPRVSLVAMRIALAEMLYGEEKLPSVAINEAVELVKKYGADNDYQFVNGLLGTVVRERDGQEQC